MYCANCGTEIPEYAMYCPLCGHRIASRAPLGETTGAPSPQPRPPAAAVKQISVSTAMLLSIIPGLGEIYLGNVGKGIVFFILALVLFAVHPIVSLIFWVYNLYATHADAKSMEHEL